MSNASYFDDADASRESSAIPVQVQCGEFRCLAYQEKDGGWRDFYSGLLLAGAVQVIDYKFA